MSKMTCDVCGAKDVTINYGDAYTVVCRSCSGTEKASGAIKQKLDQQWKTKDRCSEAKSKQVVYDVVVHRKVRRGFEFDAALSTLADELQVRFQGHEDQVTHATELDLESALVVIRRVERLGVIATLAVSNAPQENEAREGFMPVAAVSAGGRVPESVMIEGINTGELKGYIEQGVYFISVTESGGSEMNGGILPAKRTRWGPRAGPTQHAEFIECEFCLEMNKPNVTFCKHCGLKIRG